MRSGAPAPNFRCTQPDQEGVMPSTNKDTAELNDFGLAADRTDHLNDYTVNFVSIPETHSLQEALAGLPGGQCHCPHWGYVFNGKLTIDDGAPTETYAAGDAFY